MFDGFTLQGFLYMSGIALLWIIIITIIGSYCQKYLIRKYNKPSWWITNPSAWIKEELLTLCFNLHETKVMHGRLAKIVSHYHASFRIREVITILHPYVVALKDPKVKEAEEKLLQALDSIIEESCEHAAIDAIFLIHKDQDVLIDTDACKVKMEHIGRKYAQCLLPALDNYIKTINSTVHVLMDFDKCCKTEWTNYPE